MVYPRLNEEQGRILASRVKAYGGVGKFLRELVKNSAIKTTSHGDMSHPHYHKVVKGESGINPGFALAVYDFFGQDESLHFMKEMAPGLKTEDFPRRKHIESEDEAYETLFDSSIGKLKQKYQGLESLVD